MGNVSIERCAACEGGDDCGAYRLYLQILVGDVVAGSLKRGTEASTGAFISKNRGGTIEITCSEGTCNLPRKAKIYYE